MKRLAVDLSGMLTSIQSELTRSRPVQMSSLALLALLTAWPQDPPPSPPIMPHRPPPLANGVGYRGDLGTGCRDRLDPQGRWVHPGELQLAQGQRIWLSLSSAEFDAVLEVVDAEGDVVARIADTKGGQETGAFFTAQGAPSREGVSVIYAYKVTSAAPGETGRWLVEDRRDGLSQRMFTDDTSGRASLTSGGSCS